MVDPLTAIAVGGGAASAAIQGFKKKKGIQGKVRNVSDFYRKQRPMGYVTPEDEAFVERGRLRSATAIGAFHKQRLGEAINRATARGLAYSPATDYLTHQSEQEEADQLSNLNRTAQDELYGIRTNREQFERQRLMTAWGAELGAIQSDYAGQQAANASFWNSFLPVTQDAITFFGGGGAPGGNYGTATGGGTPYTSGGVTDELTLGG